MLLLLPPTVYLWLGVNFGLTFSLTIFILCYFLGLTWMIGWYILVVVDTLVCCLALFLMPTTAAIGYCCCLALVIGCTGLKVVMLS